MSEPSRIALRDLYFSFADKPILHGLNLQLSGGTLTGLLGANGAGKSTLVRILCGGYRPTQGELLIDGRVQRFTSPAVARRAGIVAVQQSVDDGIVPTLSVAENLCLDRLCQGPGLIHDRRRLYREAAAIAATLDLQLPLAESVERLGQADRQLLILARAVAAQPRLLILDEPTAALSSQEAERLFCLLERLRSAGVAILYISHRLTDLQRLADRLLVLRDGQLTGDFTRPLDFAVALEAMLGQALEQRLPIPRAPGPVVLKARGLQLLPGVVPFDLQLAQGEVVALTGLLGAGKSRLAETLFGLRRPTAGQLELDGRAWRPTDPGAAIAQGVFFAGEDRRRSSLIPGFSVRQSMTLPFLSRFVRHGLLRRREEAAASWTQVRALGIKTTDVEQDIATLSGGNQQKVVLARWLLAPARLLILDEPFQGVDVQARRDIGARIRATAHERATLVICTDPDEALEIADRILVMRDVRVVAQYRRQELDRTTLVEQLTHLTELERA